MFKKSILLSALLFFGNVQLTAISNPLTSELARAAFQISGGMCTALGASMLALGKDATFWSLLKGVNTSTSNAAGLVTTGLICLVASNPTSPSTALEIAGTSISSITLLKLSNLFSSYLTDAIFKKSESEKYSLKERFIKGFLKSTKLTLLYLLAQRITSIGQNLESIQNLQPLI